LRRHGPWIGWLGLSLSAWLALNGRLWSYERVEAHRFTARAMMTGVLWMRGAATLAGPDEQVHDGAIFTNWGFGVPLLQIPFHSFAQWTHLLSGFFPDRAIYFVYFVLLVPLLWSGIHRLIATRPWPEASRRWLGLVSWTATWLVLCCALFPISRRFIVYEETLSYMVLFELAALGAYVHACTSESRVAPFAVGLLAGVALLVRPTALIYVGTWGVLLLLERSWRKVLPFAAAVTPFVALWFCSNWARTGSPMGFGFDNSNPYYPYHTPMQRFGTACTDTAAHALQMSARLFEGLFLFVTKPSAGSWAETCHLDFEQRDPSPEPFMGPATLPLLVWMVARLVARRERRLAAYVPYAALAFLFANFVRAGGGFAWRYAGDFWPLVVLAAVQYVRLSPVEKLRAPDRRTVAVLAVCGLVVFVRYMVPWEWGTHIEALPASEHAAMWDRFADSRWPERSPLPARIACGARSDEPYHNGQGWGDGCSISTFTSVYLGVPTKAGGGYELRIETDGHTPAPIEVYVNGRRYRATREGDVYRVALDLDSARLVSPVVMATVEWTRYTEMAPPGQLLAIELG
jgi:hypothetical protein